MGTFDDQRYRQFFRKATEHEPFHYQVEVAQTLFSGRNVILRAPTGAGKTWSVIVPYVSSGWERGPSRLIYALPLRTLAQGIFHEAQQAAVRLGHCVRGESDKNGREIVSPYVTLQTGEQPDDPFFDRGRIIITTYDQVLSGLLDGPYGLSDRLHNINAAAIAGALVVFDEFHLMEPSKAFLTGVAGLFLFRKLCQSVWMTATATQPLCAMIRQALDAEPIPTNEPEEETLLISLRSVTKVSRELRMEDRQLTAAEVLRAHQRRSIVLLNTVGRAQAMYGALKQGLATNNGRTSLMLLHSRFFKQDRATKEQELRRLLAKSTGSNAILVATQVVEAGLDISCEHLHTELCPMNSLVQRAGRCARFPGEEGVVHVYPLPDGPRAWLPYGNVGREDVTLTKTREILAREGRTTLKPDRAAKWVEEAHGQEDLDSLRGGWQPRLTECFRRIEQNAILRTPVRVADLIREGSDQLRVIIRGQVSPLDRPGEWDGINLSRWSLARLIRNGAKDLGWFWNGDDADPWKKLQTEEDLQKTYVLCLRPTIAAYDSEIGIRLGLMGSVESPCREEPKRPGYSPLYKESWADHAVRVAKEAEGRLKKEGWGKGLFFAGLAQRYGLEPDALLEAVRACALLHDLGKLQQTWQRWAEAAQKAKDKDYQHVAPLAHTDFGPEKAEDRERERKLTIRRPPHSAASAYYGAVFLPRLLASIPSMRREHVASACTAAVLSHHGGWLTEGMDLGISRLSFGWEDSVARAVGWTPDALVLADLEGRRDKRGPMEQLVNLTVTFDRLQDWWPLVAYLTRALRLSDRRATAQGGMNE
jgi:CRISPR-associated endonuclease/helicase Cas3